MAADLSQYFDRFLENISLGEPQVSRMNSAASTVADFLRRSYEIPQANVFLQGSYENGTAVEPVEGGEYDVDLVAVCVDNATSPNSALDGLEQRFRSDGRFRDRVRPKKPCIRLEYAPDDVGKFHVDVVPMRVDSATSAPLDCPRRNEGWRGSDPQQYSAWCQQQGPLFLRTVRMIKRWRDEQQNVRQAIKSIVLQVLISNSMPQVLDDAERVAQTLRALESGLCALRQPPAVYNPVLPSENLAASWTQESFQSFVKELTEAREWADAATAASDVVEAAEAWREVFGDDFPIAAPAQLGLRVGDYSHAQSPEERGWSLELDPRYAVEVTAERQRGKRGQTRRPYPENGPLIFAGSWLRFVAHVRAPNHVDVWWQVANTGGHARDVDALRGEIFRGKGRRKGSSPDPTENWESTAYTGSHLIRALLVRDYAVVAQSPWFRVNIYAKSAPFRL